MTVGVEVDVETRLGVRLGRDSVGVKVVDGVGVLVVGGMGVDFPEKYLIVDVESDFGRTV